MPSSRPAPRRAATVTVRRPDPTVWAQALALAGGDVKRLTVAEDGTVVVSNKDVRGA